MNKKILLTLAAAATVGAAMYAAKKDPVVMRINGQDVTRSEFEYLYHKNAAQQLQPQSIPEYAEMFKIYKLKVADALAEGIDTTKAFQNEFKGYRVDLRAPYASDTAFVNTLMKEAYDRMGQEVEVSHIMITKPQGMDAPRDAYSLADSLHTLLMNGADFADLAQRYSADKYSAAKGGRMGWITAMMVPYDFETAAYSLQPGEISGIVESPTAYHILKGGNKRPSRGEVHASHILKMVPQGTNAEAEALIKAQVDSLYRELQNGADFAQMATKYSDDKGSGARGGELPWFGVGRMVAEFDSVAFAIPVGTISEPFRSQFGWHIVKKTGARPRAAYADIEPQLRQSVTRGKDGRSALPPQYVAKRLAKQYKLKFNDKMVARMKDFADANGLNLKFLQTFEPDSLQPFCSLADVKYTVGDFIKYLEQYRLISFPSTGRKDLTERIDRFAQKELFSYYFNHLAEYYPEYRNLENEYRDGMLLFEVSNRKVWDKAAKDTAGLKAFFEANRADYAWQAPRVKGVLLQAVNDSVAREARAMLDADNSDAGIKAVRDKFARDVKVDRVLVAQGDNPLIDALVFGAQPAANAESKYPVYLLQSFRLINAPEEVADVRAAVTSDYQNALEAAWIEELQQKYPVVIYEKELAKIK